MDFPLEQHSHIFEMFPESVFICEFDASDRLILRYGNPSSFQLVQRSSDQVIDKDLGESFPSLIEADVLEHFTRTAQTGIPWDEKRLYLRSEERELYLSVSCRQAGKNVIFLFFHDISDIVLDQKAQWYTDQKYQTLFEASGDALSIIDLQTAHFIECNDAAVRLHGTGSKDGFLNLSPHHLSPEYQPDGSRSEDLAVQHINNAFKKGAVVFNWIHRKLDGSEFPAMVSLSGFSVGEDKYVLAVGRDISHLMNIQKELESANLAKDRLFGIISHDLRNYFYQMTSLFKILELEDTQLDDHEFLALLRNMKRSSEQNASLLENLLEWSRTNTGKMDYQPEPFPLSDIFEQCIGLFVTHMEEKSITLNVSTPHQYIVHADRKMVFTILRNLLNNAVKFTSAGGEITLGCRLQESAVCILVEDNGIGMDQELQSELFTLKSEKLRRGTAGEKGSGLGLLLCQEFAVSHGSTMEVDSEPGRGTTFSFTLPLFQY